MYVSFAIFFIVLLAKQNEGFVIKRQATSCSACLNGGTCTVFGGNLYVCTCPAGYTGIQCGQQTTQSTTPGTTPSTTSPANFCKNGLFLEINFFLD